MKNKGHIPFRTCISCGSKRPKNEMLKLMLDNENRLIKDDSGRIKGRGAYVCNSRPCQERLLNNKSLNRRFRTEKYIYVDQGSSGIMPFDNKKSIHEM